MNWGSWLSGEPLLEWTTSWLKGPAALPTALVGAWVVPCLGVSIILAVCNAIMPNVMIMLYVCLTIYLLLVLLGVREYNKCMCIYTSEHHLSLSSD